MGTACQRSRQRCWLDHKPASGAAAALPRQPHEAALTAAAARLRAVHGGGAGGGSHDDCMAAADATRARRRLAWHEMSAVANRISACLLDSEHSYHAFLMSIGD